MADTAQNKPAATAEGKDVSQTEGKLKSLGIPLHNPRKTLEVITKSVTGEQDYRQSARKELDTLRDTLEKDSRRSSESALEAYTTDLQQRSQDSFVTAVTDGMIKKLTPSEVINPDKQAKEESKLQAIGDYAKSVSGGLLDGMKGEDFAAIASGDIPENSSLMGKMLSGEKLGLADLDANDIKTIAKTTDNALGPIVNMAKNALGMPPTPPGEPGFLSSVTSVISDHADTIVDFNSVVGDPYSTNFNKAGAAIGLLNSDMTGGLVDTSINKMISLVSPSAAEVPPTPEGQKAVAAVADASVNIMNGDKPGSGNKTAGNCSSSSILNALTTSSAERNCKAGNADYFLEAAVNNSMAWFPGPSACKETAQNMSQTKQNIDALKTGAAALNVDLDTVNNAEIKLPSKASNIYEEDYLVDNRPLPSGDTRGSTPDIKVIDIHAFNQMTKNGTLLARDILDNDTYCKCCAISKQTKATV